MIDRRRRVDRIPPTSLRIEWFIGIDCEVLLYTFTKEKTAFYQNYWFERVILRSVLLMILASSVKLGVETYNIN